MKTFGKSFQISSRFTSRTLVAHYSIYEERLNPLRTEFRWNPAVPSRFVELRFRIIRPRKGEKAVVSSASLGSRFVRSLQLLDFPVNSCVY